MRARTPRDEHTQDEYTQDKPEDGEASEERYKKTPYDSATLSARPWATAPARQGRVLVFALVLVLVLVPVAGDMSAMHCETWTWCGDVWRSAECGCSAVMCGAAQAAACGYDAILRLRFVMYASMCVMRRSVCGVRCASCGFTPTCFRLAFGLAVNDACYFCYGV